MKSFSFFHVTLLLCLFFISSVYAIRMDLGVGLGLGYSGLITSDSKSNDLEDYNANSWNYDVIYDGVRYTSTVTNDDVKIMLEINGELQTVIMQQWYSDLLLDKNSELTTKEEAFFGSEKCDQ